MPVSKVTQVWKRKEILLDGVTSGEASSLGVIKEGSFDAVLPASELDAGVARESIEDREGCLEDSTPVEEVVSNVEILREVSKAVAMPTKMGDSDQAMLNVVGDVGSDFPSLQASIQ
ncbi:hypothetical protein V6N12_002638 [Hibiscus sabdariffa]|uniref:Uncharacterized protein n=1 Tax=Hibiscus sabdariffa TaxID=183260 RepID=A0ABR2E9Y3_9ROSI